MSDDDDFSAEASDDDEDYGNTKGKGRRQKRSNPARKKLPQSLPKSRKRAAAAMEDDEDDAGDDDSNEDEDDEEYVADEDDDDLQEYRRPSKRRAVSDDDDEDDEEEYGSARKRRSSSGKAVATAKAKAAGRQSAAGAGRRNRPAPTYREDSEEEASAGDDDDSDVEQEEADAEEEDFQSDGDDSSGGGGGGRSGGRRKAAAPATRPRRAAARQATQPMQSRGDEDDDVDDAEDEDAADEKIARQLDRQINGLRTRPTGRRTASAAAPPARSSRNSADRRTSGGGSGDGGSSKSRKRWAEPQRASQRAAAKVVSYAESDDDDDEGGGGGRGGGGGGGRAQEPIAAFDDPSEFEDEVEKVLGHRDVEGLDATPRDCWAARELNIKWKRHSYIHTTWQLKTALEKMAGYKRVINYMRKVDDMEAGRFHVTREEQELRDIEREMDVQLNQQHMQVERVISEAELPDTGAVAGVDDVVTKYLVKWEGLPYAECTWETVDDITTSGGQAALDAFLKREERLMETAKSVDVQRRQFKVEGTRALESQPDYLSVNKLKLRDYQMESLNWMVYSWSEDRNIILADEMGLGKTVQCVAFVGHLTEALHVRGPFLVVVPLSTVPNWIREFQRWVPYVNTVVYVGDSRSREVIRAYEFDAPSPKRGGNAGRTHKFEVLITTYELILKDAPILGKVKWNYLMVDEAHRLKNPESALYQELISWNFKNKLLITGTPLQNNMRELWGLLHFLDPAKFGELADFEEQYSLKTADSVSGLHALLRPHLLRRVIKDVERSLPPKNERILRVEMSPLQKQYYKWILTRNFKELNKGTRGGAQVSLLNIITELKKCCNHPFLFESAEEEYRGHDSDRSAVDRLVVTSSKMVLLDKLMARLKAAGHRVLIFSQMVRQLDIISDYMRLRGYQHQRLDGSTPAASRHQAMEHFNKPESPDFAFLLSTRAGGLGINLATADTVIIYDSDFNPQSDLQAMSRAHRIGQTSTVNIYRFVTSRSVEEEILERAKQKMVLDHLVIQRMDTSGRTVLEQDSKHGSKTIFGKDELAAILRFGAEELFKRDEKEVAEQERQMYEEDIDAILERAEVVDTRAMAAGMTGGANGGEAAADAAGGPGELLSSFNVATFKGEEDDTAFWSKLIPVLERPKEEEELLPRQARLRAAGEAGPSSTPLGGSDDEAGASGHKRGGGGGAAASARGNRNGSRARGGKADGEPGPPVDGAVIRIDEWIVDVDERGVPVASKQEDGEGGEEGGGHRTISRRDAAAFVRGVRHFGIPERLANICAESGKALEEAAPPARLSLYDSLLDGCRRAVVQTNGEDAKDAILDFFGAAVKAQELISQVNMLKLLHRRAGALSDPVLQFRVEPAAQMSIPKWGKMIGWGPHEDALLLLGVYYHGLGHWDAVAADPRLGLQDKLASVSNPGAKDKDSSSKELRGPQASHLETRAVGLLRKMHSASRPTVVGKNKSLVPRRPRPQATSAARAAAGKAPPAARTGPVTGGSNKDAAVAGLLAVAPAAAAATGGVFAVASHKDANHKAPAGAGGGVEGTAAEGTKRKGSGGKGETGRAEKKFKSGGGVGSAEKPPKAAGLSKEETKTMLQPLSDQLKKFKRLESEESDRRVIVEKTKRYLLAIGYHVDAVVGQRGSKARATLWQAVAKAVDKGDMANVLETMYEKLKIAGAASAAAPAAVTGAVAAVPAIAPMPSAAATIKDRPSAAHTAVQPSSRPSHTASAAAPAAAAPVAPAAAATTNSSVAFAQHNGHARHPPPAPAAPSAPSPRTAHAPPRKSKWAAAVPDVSSAHEQAATQLHHPPPPVHPQRQPVQPPQSQQPLHAPQPPLAHQPPPPAQHAPQPPLPPPYQPPLPPQPYALPQPPQPPQPPLPQHQYQAAQSQPASTYVAGYPSTAPPYPPADVQHPHHHQQHYPAQHAPAPPLPLPAQHHAHPAQHHAHAHRHPHHAAPPPPMHHPAVAQPHAQYHHHHHHQQQPYQPPLPYGQPQHPSQMPQMHLKEGHR